MAAPDQMARHRLTHDAKTNETNFRSARHTRAYAVTASVIIHLRSSFSPADFRMSLSWSGVNFRCLTEMAGNMSLFVSNFFSMALEQKHYWQVGIFRYIKNQIDILEKSTLEQNDCIS